jgi:hypothetical protein
VPSESPALTGLLAHVHSYSHEGTKKMLHRLRVDFHVPDAHALVCNFMSASTTCQRNKTDQLQLVGLLQLLPVPLTVWADIMINFIEGLPKFNDRSVILTVINRFSKSTHFLQLGHPYMATIVVPSLIISDHNPTFTCRF